MSLSVDIHKKLGTFELNVQFASEDPHEIFALLGASGCGKSATLKCIAGVERPDAGRIVLNDRVLFDSEHHISVAPQQRHVGYLFQNYALFPTMSVMQNIMVGMRGSTRAERVLKAYSYIERFHLEGLEQHRPAQLSGGQQQRCALARILASEPELLLLDEPFSALDGYLRWQIELELIDTLRAFPGGVVFVTHSRDEVYRICDRVCVLTDGHSGNTMPKHELFDAPVTRSEALMSGCKNISAAQPYGDKTLRCLNWGVTLLCNRTVTTAAFVGIRAHFLRIVEVDGRTVGSVDAVVPGAHASVNHIPCCVDRVIDNVFSTIVMCKTPGEALVRVELDKTAWAQLGQPHHVTLEVDPADVMPLEV